MFKFLKKKAKYFTEQERAQIVEAIRVAEKRTSGEIRLYVEKHCRFMDAMDRAAELFFHLQMQKTDDRNAVLVYVAIKDRQLAIFGDEGIYKKTGNAYWVALVEGMLRNFNTSNYAEGIKGCVAGIGEGLHKHFPFDNVTDKNELPDDIVFGD